MPAGSVSEQLKTSTLVNWALRYNPFFYGALRKQLRLLRSMDAGQRRTLSDRLLRRALGWAAGAPGGANANVPLQRRPFVEREQLRDEPERFAVRGLVRVSAATSGSTGIPLDLVRSLRCIAAEQAFIDDLTCEHGFELRSARVARLRADTIKPVDDRSPPFGELSANARLLVLSSNHLSAETALWYHDALQRFRPEVLFVHPSAAEPLAAYLQRRGLGLTVPVVLSSSEAVLGSGRQLIEAVFNTKLLDYYGMAERVAFAAGSSDGCYYFNPLYGRVELLPIDAAEAPAGARAFEIVATGFWNDAMPLVRYRCGDRAIVPAGYTERDLDEVALGLRPVLAIQGRGKEHLVTPSGVNIIGMSNATNGIRGLVRMQLVQEARDRVRADVIIDPTVGSIDEAQLLRNMRLRLSEDIAVTIRRVEQLERLPSGKTPFIIQRSGWSPPLGLADAPHALAATP